ncbi:MAG TPA: DNA internalization-related competence protein ComEC/Rec2 [Gemmatimonadaceae bacterium]|nr:DNA internalization-related competence protein ComEC/Rec2 [Gemmatimonadaceae bacterium]
MPLVAAAVLAYAGGLLTGFGGAYVWTASAVAIVIASGRRTASERLALVAIAVAACAVAASADRTVSACAVRLARATSWRLTLEAEAQPGAFVAAHHECGAAVKVAVERGVARAGATSVVTGVPQASRGALLIQHAGIAEVEAPSTLRRWRSAIGRGIDEHFGSDAPLVRALLIADMAELSPGVRDRFAAAGMSHMLSVSGLHVGLIAVAVALFAQMLSLPRAKADTVVMIVTAFYVAVIGAPLPAVRSAAMLGAHTLSRTRQRPTSPWATLAVGAAFPLAAPSAVLDVGYQLSVAGMVALIAAGALASRWTFLKQRGWRGNLYRGLMTSLLATLLTAPLVAATFGRVSTIAPLSNLVAVPIVAVLQPMLFLGAVLLPVPPLAQFVADAAHPLLAAVDRVASAAASVPGATISVAVDGGSLMLATAAVAALVVAIVSRFPGRALVASAGCCACLAWRPLIASGSGTTELHMIDVGQGDAIALRTARGRWVLFDAGGEWRGGDEGKRDVVPYVSRRGGAVVAFVLSHPHADHVGGAASVLHALRPRVYLDPGYAGGTTPYRASLLEAQRSHIRWSRIHPGDSLVVDEATITFLAPDSAWAEAQGDPNLASTVARVRVGDVTMLLTGDAEAPEERWLLAHAADRLRADILKVAHHGSNTSTTQAFLDSVRPRLALVSVGTGNIYGHPSAAVLRSLAAHGAVSLRTDHNGTIVVRTDGTHVDVEVAGERWPIP